MNRNESILLETQDLKLHFYLKKKRVVRAVDGVNLAIKQGETLGIVGESGCGKSTLARAIALLHKPTAGSVFFNGQNLMHLNKRQLLQARKSMQMIFQDPFASLDPRMTLRQLISEPLRIFKSYGLLDVSSSQIEEKTAALMQKAGLPPDFANRYPNEFSGGQRQRIGIARALALNPKLILADEPTSALDVSIQSQILNLMKDLQTELGISYMFIAHDLAVVRYISTHIAVMYLGKIVETAPTQILYENPLHPYTQALLAAVPIPDPSVERQRQRIILKSDLSSASQTTGCAFYSRCPRRMEQCARHAPTLKETNKGHCAACFLF